MVTIVIDENTRKRLLLIADDLEKKIGRKLDLNSVINFLARQYELSTMKAKSSEKSSIPIDLKKAFDELQEDFVRERKILKKIYGRE